MPNKLAGNLAMTFSKICSGLNQNALRYLQPHWMDAFTGVLLRLSFAGIAFWLLSFFVKRDKRRVTASQIAQMLLIGFVCVYGYMLGLLLSLTYSTPISSSLIICTQPVWVLILAAIFTSEKITARKVLGILLGFGGCLICILTQQKSHLATDPLLGNCCCIAGTFCYSIYIVASKKLLEEIDDITFNKWVFLGGALASLCGVFWFGFDAPVLKCGLFSMPMLVLLFVLIFPSTISYFLMAVGMENLSACVVAIYGYLILIVAMLASYILGQDKFEWVQMLAVLLIVASVYFVEIADFKKQPQKAKRLPR